MIVSTITGEYDDEAEHTAHDLAADHWWIDANYLAQVVGGRVRWEHVEYHNGGYRVCVWRLDTKKGLRVIKRYINPETKMRLIKI